MTTSIDDAILQQSRVSISEYNNEWNQDALKRAQDERERQWLAEHNRIKEVRERYHAKREAGSMVEKIRYAVRLFILEQSAEYRKFVKTH